MDGTDGENKQELKCHILQGTLFGTLEIEGKVYPVYLGNMTQNTAIINGSLTAKRKFTLIEI